MEYETRSLTIRGLDPKIFGRIYEGWSASPRPCSGADFSLGIEEEYFLVDKDTKCAVLHSPDSLFETAGVATEGRVDREFLQCQVEVATPPYCSMAAAREELGYIRRVLGTVAGDHGLTILASGTHPTALWDTSVQSDKEHYRDVMTELQMIGRRNMLCGMHVHVELPEPSRRIDVMRRMLPYLPLFLALSTSSPFWKSQRTGLAGYRLAAYDELPRTGMPDLFADEAEFTAYVDALRASGVITDAGQIWWMLRPSVKYPTLELRAPDSCTRLPDALAIAALYRVLVRRIYRDPRVNCDIDSAQRALALENKWRAQRYGVRGGFATGRGLITISSYLEDVLELVAEDAVALDCRADVEDCRRIVARGSSADRQIDIYDGCVAERGEVGALQEVCEWLARETIGSAGAASR
jgi:glutamate---cysteine ligase / carboxylate-amine ligase